MTTDELTAARLRSLSRMARAYAHEVRGASNALAIHTELLSRSVAEVEEPDLQARQARYVRSVGEQRQRMQHLIDVMLGALVALDDDPVAAFDLGEVLAGLGALLAPQSIERRTPLEMAANGPLPMTGRRHAVEQAVLDVLLWALDRTPAGGRVGVAVTTDPERVRLRIDTASELGNLPADPGFATCDALVRLAGGTLRSGPTGGALEVELPCSDRGEEEGRHA